MMDRPPRDDDARHADTPAEDAPEDTGGAAAPPVAEAGPDAERPVPSGRDVIEVRPNPDEQPSPDGEPGQPPAKDAPHPPPRSVWIGALAVLLATVAWGGYEHWRTYADSAATTDHTVNQPIEVRTTVAKRIDAPVELTLPGETQALDTANIYPRATGYVDKRLVDIGSRIKTGDLMVHISAPDLDQQLAQAEAQIGQTRAALVQAKAQVAQAEANVNLAEVNLARASTLTEQGYATQQNRDTQQANTQTQQANVASARAGVAVAEANIKAQEAVIDRLKALTAFEDVRAPFDGVVTTRNVDVGELVSADQSTGVPMFTTVRDSIMRVLIRVPQNVSAGVRDGLEAKITVPQLPQTDYRGTITRTSSAVLYASRTLTTEVDLPNPDGAIRAGLYVTASLAIPRTGVQVSVPAETLIFDQHGTHVAVVENGAAKLVPVNIWRDEGKTLDIRDGLRGGERLILNPPATLQDGEKVNDTPEDEQKTQNGQPQASGAGNAKTAPSDDQNGGSG